MQAIIKKLQVKKIINSYYIKIELTDFEGNNYVIDKPFLNDEINFRKQVFGIMSACHSFDLMRLTTDSPIPKKIVGYYMNGLQILENDKSDWLIYDKEKEVYSCKKSGKKKKKIIDMLIQNDISNISKEEGQIESITSQSGVFQLLFNSKYGSTFFTTGQVYYGFGYPLNIGNEKDEVAVKKSAKIFTSFIISLMKLYKINDILDFGQNKEILPLVEIIINNNEIVSITNPNTGIGLSIGEKYDVINISNLDKQKTK